MRLATRATPPAIVHLTAAQLRAVAAVLEVRGINPNLTKALDKAATEIDKQHPQERPDNG